MEQRYTLPEGSPSAKEGVHSRVSSGYRPETICIQGGWTPGKGEPRVLPIYQSTTFKYDTSEQMARLFDLEDEGYFYTRLQNPTNDAVAQKICALEGGAAAMLTSSGQAATFYSIFNIASAGDHVISSATIYGGSSNLFTVTLKKLGIDFTLVDPEISPEELEKEFKPNTRAVFGETISNPSLVVLDIEKFAKAAHDHGVPLILDNTFATPINCRPFEFGADIVTHSTTKYMDGHAMSVGGCIVDSGNFDWMAHKEKFPGLTTPDESYHGLVYAEAFGKKAYITKATAQLMRDLGAIQSPQNAFLLNVGLETLHLRVPCHCENARKVAEYLEACEDVAWVNYPGLKSSPYYERAKKYMPGGTCGVIAFGLKGGRERSIKFMDSLKLAAIVTHVADARTSVLHPASHTHRQLSDEQLIEAGVKPDLIRFSVGIENAVDIIADIEQALDAVR
jgi:O-acetylhomoserine (thiol)-lyase